MMGRVTTGRLCPDLCLANGVNLVGICGRTSKYKLLEFHDNSRVNTEQNSVGAMKRAVVIVNIQNIFHGIGDHHFNNYTGFPVRFPRSISASQQMPCTGIYSGRNITVVSPGSMVQSNVWARE